jgi:hypothetical protein
MTQHEHEHEHGKQHHGHEQHHHSGRKKTPIHKHWLTWVVIALMLGAMLMYIFSDDESLQPDAASQGTPVKAAP